MNADRDDMLNSLYEAQEHMQAALEQLDFYVSESGDSNAKAYLVDHLRIMTSRDHGFLTHDLSVDDLIERVNSDDGEEETR